MKSANFILLILSACLSVFSLNAAEAEVLVDQGRDFLIAHDLPSAHEKFGQALQADPEDDWANFYFAITRLLNLTQTPEGTAFMDKLGLDEEGRDIYHWTASIPSDEQGDPVAPEGVSVTALSDYLRTEALPEIIGAGVNLSKIDDQSFLTMLTAAETTHDDVFIDYADIQLLRAGLKFFEYWIYTAGSWNLDVQITEIKELSMTDALSIERLLNDYPNLFTFATVADQSSAAAAFSAGADIYMQASLSIRNRETQEFTLFQFDPEMSDDEEGFRLTLQELKDSLTTPVTSEIFEGLTLDLSRHFSPDGALRQFFPQFKGDAFVVRSLPDATFGGAVLGLKPAEIENFIGENVSSAPVFTDIKHQGLNNGEIQLTFSVAVIPVYGALLNFDFEIQSSERPDFQTYRYEFPPFTIEEDDLGVIFKYSLSYPSNSATRFFRIETF